MNQTTHKSPPQIAPAATNGAPRAGVFIGTAEVSASTAKMRLVQIAEEIIGVLASDPQANVKVRLEINADFPRGRFRPNQTSRLGKRQ